MQVAMARLLRLAEAALLMLVAAVDTETQLLHRVGQAAAGQEGKKPRLFLLLAEQPILVAAAVVAAFKAELAVPA